jgi:glycosyltransferase involved in cell wall biosynthesis
MARITVFTPTYRRPDTLRIAMRSALAQTFTDFEYLIRDNTEDDSIERVVREFDDSRIRYVRNTVNAGAQGNWIGAIVDAECDVVASLHDDDAWEPTFLEKVAVPLVDDPSLAVGFCDHWLMDGAGRRLQTESEAWTAESGRDHLPAGRVERSRAGIAELLLADKALQPCYNAAFRRDLIDVTQIPDWVAPICDLWHCYLVAKTDHPLWYVPERLTSYRLHAGQITEHSPYFDRVERIYEAFLSDDDDAMVAARGPIAYRLAVLQAREAVALAQAGRRNDAAALLHAATPRLTPVERRRFTRALLKASLRSVAQRLAA